VEKLLSLVDVSQGYDESFLLGVLGVSVVKSLQISSITGIISGRRCVWREM
jgi:hypothetical protein